MKTKHHAGSSSFPIPSERVFARRAFTLIELLIGIVLLSILGLLVVQLINATTRATRMSNIGIDAAAQARLAFDRIGLDIAALVKRPDVGFQATNSLGSGPPYPLLFVSEVTSAGIPSTNNRGISLVAYQINTNSDTTNACLLRGSTPIAWSGTNSRGFFGYQTNGLPVSLSSAPITLAAQDFDVLAPAVIRAVIGFQLYPSNEKILLASGAEVTAIGQIVYSPPVLKDKANNPSTALDKNQISSLVVGLVAIDPGMLKRLDSSQTSALANCFPTPLDGELPVGNWTVIAENTAALPSTVPLPARQSLRVFQRAFPITPYGVNAP